MAGMNNNFYVVHRSRGFQRGIIPSQAWWLVKHGGVLNINIIKFPKTFEGKRIKLKVELMDNNLEEVKTKMEFKKVKEIPPSQFKGDGKVNERTLECIENLGEMLVDDVFHLPITDTYKEAELKEMRNRYMHSIKAAMGKYPNRKFKASVRGFDVFVKRLE